MVNRLRLSPLAAPQGSPAAGGPSPLAVVSFAVLASLFATGMGLHLFGDPRGGTPHVALAIDTGAEESSALLRLAEEDQNRPETRRQAPSVMSDEAETESVAIEPQTIRVIPAEEASEASVSGNPARPSYSVSRVSLAPAPLARLQTAGEHGPVPVIGPGGERPADVYARPYANPQGLPRVALIIGGLGLNAQATRAAIERLPGEVTLSFVPYAENLQTLIDSARDFGHEVMIELPLEPFDYPNNDPGPATLLTSNDWPTNASRLDWVMSRAAGYVGLMNYQGARLTSDAESFTPVLRDLAARGLIYLDDGTSPRSLTARVGQETGGDWAIADGRIDLRRSADAVGTALSRLETTAAEDGVAIGVGFAYPVTVEQIVSWAETLEAKGLSLAPLSAVTHSETG